MASAGGIAALVRAVSWVVGAATGFCNTGAASLRLFGRVFPVAVVVAWPRFGAFFRGAGLPVPGVVAAPVVIRLLLFVSRNFVNHALRCISHASFI